MPSEQHDQEFEVEIENQASPTVRVRIRGRIKAATLEEAYRRVAETVASSGLSLGTAEARWEVGAKRFPAELLPHLSSLTNKEFVTLLLYFEGPISRDQISQRSRELGKSVSKTWLDTEFFRRPVKDLFISETDASGVRLYRLTEIGRVEAEATLSRLREKR